MTTNTRALALKLGSHVQENKTMRWQNVDVGPCFGIIPCVLPSFYSLLLAQQAKCQEGNHFPCYDHFLFPYEAALESTTYSLKWQMLFLKLGILASLSYSAA